MTNTAEKYEPVRDSTRTERQRLVADISDLQKRLADTERRSELGADPAYSRTAARLRKQINTACEKVQAFDEKQRLLDAARNGAAAKAAQKEAQKAARNFEEKLAAFAASASALKVSAAALADALQIRDPGIWPSIQSVDTTVRGRVIEVLGLAGIKMVGFGSFAKPSEPLTRRFALNQGK